MRKEIRDELTLSKLPVDEMSGVMLESANDGRGSKGIEGSQQAKEATRLSYERLARSITHRDATSRHFRFIDHFLAESWTSTVEV